jgi:thiol-disulfide isomerase/thioredoxin
LYSQFVLLVSFSYFFNHIKDDDQAEYQKILADNVNKRLQGALEEIKHRHATGTNQLDDVDRAPTGSAYQRATLMQQQQQHQQVLRNQQIQEAQVFSSLKKKNKEDQSDDDELDDEDEDEFLKDDPELDIIRQRRLNQLREQQIQHALHRSLGHGQLRTISQDEFLTECTGQSLYVAVHFFHKDFERCKIMDHHLQIIATKYIQCKFLRIDAEKTPFFVDKLKVRTLPTLFVFKEGKVVERLTGFEGLVISEDEPDKWHTPSLEKWLHSTGAIRYSPSEEEKAAEMEMLQRKKITNRLWRQQGNLDDEED